jgi:hypothetical protein
VHLERHPGGEVGGIAGRDLGRRDSSRAILFGESGAEDERTGEV